MEAEEYGIRLQHWAMHRVLNHFEIVTEFTEEVKEVKIEEKKRFSLFSRRKQEQHQDITSNSETMRVKRDDNNFILECKSLDDKEHILPYNPMFMLSRNEYVAYANSEFISRNYIYFNVDKVDSKLESLLKSLMGKENLKVLYTKEDGKVRDKGVYYNLRSLKQYVACIKQASYVISDNYHDIALAIIMNVPFGVIVTEENSSISTLLKDFKLSNHIIDFENKEMLELLKLPKPSNIKRKLRQIKAEGYSFVETEFNVRNDEDYVKCPTNIKKAGCYGCFLCKEICPTNAISMVEDKEGFYFPVVDDEKCVNCNLCNKQCIRNNNQLKDYTKDYPRIYSAMNKDEEIRMGSTSGAIFPALAQYVINEKHGVVVGVKYDDDMRPVSAIANTMEEVKKFYGSKYVKSYFDGIFPQIKELLNQGKFVLYSGLPCECAGLRAFLRKDYDNLIICEILCHASPSPQVFLKYIRYLQRKHNSKVVNFTFRNKQKGWLLHEATLVIEFENGKVLNVNARRNNYFRAFLNDFIGRESCTNCEYTFRNRVGDITIGDFWGIKEIDLEMFDNKGVSFVMVNNEQGNTAWEAIKDEFKYKTSNIEDIFKKNHKMPSLYKDERDLVLGRYKDEPIDKLLEEFNDLKKKK